MSQHLREQWRRVAAPTSWRPVSDINPTYTADCVILTQYVGTRRYFEVYTYGVAFGNRPTLEGAKAAVEEIYGRLEWTRVDVPKVEVVHYYFGPTDEFSDPVTIYTAPLPRLG